MPTSPKIPKDIILKAALELLIAEGYNNVNIKTIAKKIGCSTQPISWHFKNMDGLRAELCDYALDYANSIMTPADNDPNPFNSVGEGYIKIAYDYPNLFKYLYLDGGSRYHLGNLKDLQNDHDNDVIAMHIAEGYNITFEEAKTFVQDVIIYTHGLLTFVVCNILDLTKDDVRNRLHVVTKALMNNLTGEKK